jgi:YVTN family beta-propeller protein
MPSPPNTVTHTITVGDTPRGITASNGNIYVENYQAGTISIIDPLTHTASSEYPVGNTPAGMTTVGTDLYISRFTDNVVSIFDTTNNTLKSSCLADSTSPTFTMQFYSDVGLTTPIADNATLKSGTYYIKITSDEALTGAPTITINAEGTANDVTDATTTLIS